VTSEEEEEKEEEEEGKEEEEEEYDEEEHEEVRLGGAHRCGTPAGGGAQALTPPRSPTPGDRLHHVLLRQRRGLRCRQR